MPPPCCQLHLPAGTKTFHLIVLLSPAFPLFSLFPHDSTSSLLPLLSHLASLPHTPVSFYVSHYSLIFPAFSTPRTHSLPHICPSPPGLIPWAHTLAPPHLPLCPLYLTSIPHLLPHFSRSLILLPHPQLRYFTLAHPLCTSCHESVE